MTLLLLLLLLLLHCFSVAVCSVTWFTEPVSILLFEIKGVIIAYAFITLS
jgi:hypothetical protein